MVTKLKKKSSFSKIHVACSNTDLFLLYYEPWQVRKPGIFIIRGIFRTLEYSKVRRYLDSRQTYCNIFGKQFQATIIFAGRSFLDHFRCLGDSKCSYVSINATQLVQSFQVLFQAYSDIFENYSRAYSRIFSTFCIPGIFRTLAYSYHKAYSDSKVYS